MSNPLFHDFRPGPEDHFRIHFLGSVLLFIRGVCTATGSMEQAFEHFPFLIEYNNRLAERVDGLSSADAFQCWGDALDSWEQKASVHLPLQALCKALAADHAQMMWLLLPGLVEEDARFGLVCEALDNSTQQRRPSLDFLRRCWPFARGDAINLLSRLQHLGILDRANTDAAHPEWIFKFPPAVWD